MHLRQRGNCWVVPRSSLPKLNDSSANADPSDGAERSITRHLRYAFQSSSGLIMNWRFSVLKNSGVVTLNLSTDGAPVAAMNCLHSIAGVRESACAIVIGWYRAFGSRIATLGSDALASAVSTLSIRAASDAASSADSPARANNFAA